MKALTHQELRAKWFAFWKERGHHEMPSAPLIPKSNDDFYLNQPGIAEIEKTLKEYENSDLLWVNSGVAGLKDYFLGKTKPPAKRLVNIQKSVRTNDLTMIGKTNRHLTFFEMMGNFAIDGYDRRQAILWAWEFLTDANQLAIDPTKLVLVYFKEDPATLKILKDELNLSDKQIVAGGRSTNFWDLGVGPCGPNLEFYYDYGTSKDPTNQGTKLLEQDIENDRYLEIWNIVFSEFINDGKGKIRPAPSKNIDTGAGFERLLMILQNKPTPFETDLFKTSRNWLASKMNVPYRTGPQSQLSSDEKRILITQKIILDHYRTSTFIMSDLLEHSNLDPDKLDKDLLPPIDLNFGRGYIFRKLIRTAILKARTLHPENSSFATLSDIYIKQFEKSYPNLKRHSAYVNVFIKREEEVFLANLNFFQNNYIWNDTSKTILGKDIFDLVATFGIPYEFIQNQAEKNNFKLEKKEFQKLWESHQKCSAQKELRNRWIQKHKPFFSNKFQKPTPKIEYTEPMTLEIKAIFKKNKLVQSAKNKNVALIFEKTPFTPTEQNFDTFFEKSDYGEIESNGVTVHVLKVYKNKWEQYVHFIDKKCPLLKTGQTVKVTLNKTWKETSPKGHSAAVIVPDIFREIDPKAELRLLSTGSGPMVQVDMISSKKLNTDEITHIIESKMSEIIKKAVSLEKKRWSYEKAEQKGVLFFTERLRSKNYEEYRRIKYAFRDALVAYFGSCGHHICTWNHVKNTKEIESFKIAQVKNIGNNIYRIVAFVTEYGWKFFEKGVIKLYNEALSVPAPRAAKIKLHNQLFADSSGTQIKKNVIHREAELITKEHKIKYQDYKKKLLISTLQQKIKSIKVPNSAVIKNRNSKFIFFDATKQIQELSTKNKTVTKKISLINEIGKSWIRFADFVLLTERLDSESISFLISDRRKNVSEEWVIFLRTKFKSNSKLGGTNRWCQGKLFQVKTEDFLALFKKELNI